MNNNNLFLALSPSLSNKQQANFLESKTKPYPFHYHHVFQFPRPPGPTTPLPLRHGRLIHGERDCLQLRQLRGQLRPHLHRFLHRLLLQCCQPEFRLLVDGQKRWRSLWLQCRHILRKRIVWRGLVRISVPRMLPIVRERTRLFLILESVRLFRLIRWGGCAIVIRWWYDLLYVYLPWFYFSFNALSSGMRTNRQPILRHCLCTSEGVHERAGKCSPHILLKITI